MQNSVLSLLSNCSWDKCSYFIKNKEERKGPQEINGGIDQAGCGKLQLSFCFHC